MCDQLINGFARWVIAVNLDDNRLTLGLRKLFRQFTVKRGGETSEQPILKPSELSLERTKPWPLLDKHHEACITLWFEGDEIDHLAHGSVMTATFQFVRRQHGAQCSCTTPYECS